jgi:hypothetical protein
VCDKTDPWFNEQTRVVEKRYKELGGQISIIINEGNGSDRLPLTDRTTAIDFIVAKAGSTVRADATPGEIRKR